MRGYVNLIDRSIFEARLKTLKVFLFVETEIRSYLPGRIFRSFDF